ncbi:MAG: GNAT family N-acetyltransferase [Pseudomonadales bacterium]
MPVDSESAPANELQVTFRDVTDADFEWLITLRQETMGPHLERSGRPLSPAEDRRRVQQDYQHIQILETDGVSIGMLKVIKTRDAWKVVQIQIVPDHQGRGIGSQVLAGLLAKAADADAPVVLSVLRVNPAKRLYERLGFRVVGEKPWAFEMRADPQQRSRRSSRVPDMPLDDG